MALAPAAADDEDDANNLLALEEDPKLLTKPEAAKTRIIALREDAERKTDYQKRLVKKLHILDQALANQREYVESLERTLLLEKERDTQDENSRQVEATQKREMQEDKIRSQLQEVLYAKPTSGKKALDTVLITYIKPNENIRYKLPFRVDKDTTLKHLLEDACKYWACAESEHILKTMANSKCQNEIMVQDCFKQGEIAQLRLEKKNREQTEVTEAEEKAIQPKNKSRSRRGPQVTNFSDLGANLVMAHNDKYTSQMRQLGGTYFLAKLREPKPTEHWNKIKLRDIVIYSTLAVITFATYYYQRQPGESYWFLKGIEDSFMEEVSRPYTGSDYSKTVPPFTEVRTYYQVWDWLQITLPHVVWGDGTSASAANRKLNDYNLLPGYVNIRVKNVKSVNPLEWEDRGKYCKHNDMRAVLTYLPGAQCTPIYVDSDTESTERLVPMDRYWQQRMEIDRDTDIIRGPAQPWRHVSSNENYKDHNQYSVVGTIQTYDAGGYTVDYKAQIPEVAVQQNLQFYNQDMNVFRALDWININTTRAVIIELNVHNYDYDKWASLTLLFEMPISGQVQPKMILREYIPNLHETRSEMYVIYAYFGRLVIGLYIFVLVGGTEIRHKIKNQKAGYLYYCSFCGLNDLGIFGCCLGALLLRYLSFRERSTANALRQLADPIRTKGFYSYGQESWEYESVFIIEGFLFLFTMCRLVSLVRLNKTVFLIWRVIGQALEGCLYFSIVFLATGWGFIVVGSKIWGESLPEFQNLSNTCMSIFHLSKGTLDFTPMIRHDLAMSAIYYIGYYIFVTFMLVSGFTMIFIESYYMVMLTNSASDTNWDAQRWRSWFIHPVVLSLWQYFTTGGTQAN
mmetsp:Transcript_90033/g.155988  ORF Transcript_90033/g.155988 Transcript_90033/m.155988 type:complete len:854 (+) Transcript_90033:115-2676(+)